MACLRPTHQHIQAVLWVPPVNSTHLLPNLHHLQHSALNHNHPAQYHQLMVRPSEEARLAINHSRLIAPCPTHLHQPTKPVQDNIGKGRSEASHEGIAGHLGPYECIWYPSSETSGIGQQKSDITQKFVRPDPILRVVRTSVTITSGIGKLSWCG